MRVCTRLGAAGAAVIAAGLLSCGQDAKSSDNSQLAQPAATTPAAAIPIKNTSRRLVGTWRIDLSEIPPDAMTKQFRAILETRKGTREGASVDYIFTDNEMVLSMEGMGSREQRRWYYEILRQVGDNLEIQREAPDGKKDKMALTVTDDRLSIHTGRAMIKLERVP